MSLVWTLADDSADRIDTYGSNLTQGLAQLSLDPLLKQDRIALGVLANRMLALPDVAGVSVITIDNRVLAASGKTDNGVRFTEPITFDDSILGYVRIELRADVRPFPMASILISLLSALMVPLVTVGAFSIRYQPAAANPADSEVVAEPVATVDHHLVAVNLYNQISMTPDARRIELDHAFEVAERVAGPYLGEVQELPGTGLLVHFPTTTQNDRALQVVCATFVLAELLAQYETDDVSSYRLGLHTVAL
ncbi:MAG: hypothetical protein OES38_16770, partial [Gammaproteobacteria bacterium]|nr:hypothetical protein [Gammaproteobacteria bacterium]